MLRDVAGGFARQHLHHDAVGVFEALDELRLALPVVLILVLLRAQLAAAEVVNEMYLHIGNHQC